MSVSIIRVQAKDGFQFLCIDGWFSTIQSRMKEFKHIILVNNSITILYIRTWPVCLTEFCGRIGGFLQFPELLN